MCVLLLFSHSVVSDSLQPHGLCVTGIKWVLARDTAEHPTVHGTAPQYRELMIQPEVNCVQVEKPWFRPWWLVRSLKLFYMYSLNSHDSVGFICAKLHSRVRLCDPMDCSPPGSSVHGIFQVRILEWVATPFSRGSPDPGIKPESPALQTDYLPSEPPGKECQKCRSWIKRVRESLTNYKPSGGVTSEDGTMG